MTPPPATAPHARSRSAQASLVVFAVALLVLLAGRSYGPRVSARPTDLAVAAPVDLNTGDRAELLQVPGIGPGMAERIVGHRQAHGPFASVEELQAVPGVGDKTLDKLRPFLTVHALAAPPTADAERLERKPPAAKPPAGRGGKIQSGEPPVNVNAADLAALQRLPGVGPALAARIVETRAAKPFATADDLRRVRGIGAKTLETIRPYVCCE